MGLKHESPREKQRFQRTAGTRTSGGTELGVGELERGSAAQSERAGGTVAAKLVQ